jgi:hypothetical protein
MSSEIIVGVLSLFGTLCGTVGGILAANKLVTYRLEQLEKKVDKHNNVIERMYKIEERVAIVETDIKDMRKDIDDGK